jgi:hypothetical protein
METALMLAIGVRVEQVVTYSVYSVNCFGRAVWLTYYFCSLSLWSVVSAGILVLSFKEFIEID